MKVKLSALLILSTISSANYSQEIYASKTGPFKKFDTCKLAKDSGTIEIGNNFSHKLIQTTIYGQHELDYLHLLLPAINARENETFRWFPSQTDYFAKRGNELVKFYASGFSNIHYQSIEAKLLVSRIDELCETRLSDFKIIGNFELDLLIGNRIFKDYLKIERTNDQFGSKITGEYEVPNSFTSKIRKLNYDNGKFSFIIRVQEGVDDYKAIFEGTLDQKNKLSGNAYILPDRKLLGTFTGIKTNENNI